MRQWIQSSRTLLVRESAYQMQAVTSIINRIKKRTLPQAAAAAVLLLEVQLWQAQIKH